MYQRTLASIVLVTLLFAQAAQGLCQLRCTHKPSAQTSSCHAMAMPAGQPSVHAEAPCPTQSCPPDHTLAGAAQAFNPDPSNPLTHQPVVLAATIFGFRFTSPINSPPRPNLLAQRTPPALPRLTSLRL